MHAHSLQYILPCCVQLQPMRSLQPPYGCPPCCIQLYLPAQASCYVNGPSWQIVFNLRITSPSLASEAGWMMELVKSYALVTATLKDLHT